MSQSEDVLSELEQRKCIIDLGLEAESPDPAGFGGWGQSPQPLGNFSEKQTILMPLDHIPHVLRTI